MNAIRCLVGLAVSVVFAGQLPAAEKALELQRGVPPDVYLAITRTHNPERDYQNKYYDDIWKTVRDTKIVDRIAQIITTRMPPEERQKAQAVLDDMKQALEPLDIQAVTHSKEFVYAQMMEPPTSQHLILLKNTPETAAGCAKAFQNLFALIEKRTNGTLHVETSTDDAVTLTFLTFPPQIPFRLTVANTGDVFLFATSEHLAKDSLAGLLGKRDTSKFDDERIKHALSQLPRAEDGIMIYDGRKQLEQMHGMLDMIAQQAAGAPEAQRWLGVARSVLDQMLIVDYQVSVEYTEGYENRSAGFGKLAAGYEGKLLTKVLGSGQPFDDWQRWVPADATSYSLSTGANLHAVYEFAIDFIDKNVPEAKDGLDQFEKLQEQVGVHIDRDLLQSFSGEHISVTLPSKGVSALSGQESVLALRCNNPDRIRELLHRLFDQLNKHPAVKAQQLGLKPAEKLEGFEEVSSTFLSMFGVRPVIGFREGWMILGSNADAVDRFLAAAKGSPTIADTEGFKKFKLEVHGPVNAIGYKDLASSTRQTAAALGKVGLFAPMIIGMAGAQAKPEDLKPVQEVLALLPDIARIVGKFDFLEARLSVKQAGSEPGTWTQRSVTLVRPPMAEAAK